MALRKSVRVALVISLFVASAFSQTLPDKPKPEPQRFHSGQNEFGAWGGFSPVSATAIGVTTDRKFFELGLNWSRVILAGRVVAWKYVLDVVPMAFITQPAESEAPPFVPAPVSKPARTIYGAGFNPLGMQLNLRNTKKVQPFADIHGGLLYFQEQVPVLGSQQFNFTASWGGGVQFFSREDKTVSVGYRFHHLSNNEGAPRNPGNDANVFYVGFSWLKR